MSFVLQTLGNLLYHAVFFTFVMPFLSTLVRYRANHTPKLLQLPEDDNTPPADAVVSSYFGIMRLVYRIEVRRCAVGGNATQQPEQGWAGLYKGVVPALLTTILAPLLQAPITMVAAWYEPGSDGQPLSFAMIILITLFFVLLLPLASAILLIPMQVITYRAITTSHHLPFRSLKTALSVLLTPLERRRPYLLYLAPGVAAANLLLAFSAALIGLPFQFLIMVLIDPRGQEDTMEKIKQHLAVIIVASVAAFVLLILFLTPLRLMRVRLALQRREAPFSEGEPSAEEIQDAPLIISEPVICLRNSADSEYGAAPYTSLISCMRHIIREEGWRVLFRGWWIVMLQFLTAPSWSPGSSSPLFTLLW
ncbi:hypothetical protein MKEN_01138200 [Mycena kentingensis (nom. inval.)]|nr:hypothetical protein MKEN_01138200 [Mycena kentingensis (nom. inval.)]